jgi:hypothetical protein
VPGTNVVAVKANIHNRLLASTADAMAGVQVDWSNASQRDVPRKRLSWASAANRPRFTQTQSAASNGSRVPRTEEVRYRVLVHVMHQGKGGPEQADLDAAAIGWVLEEILADSPDLDHEVTALETVRVVGGEIETVTWDEKAFFAELAYDLLAVSRYIH